MSVVPSAQPTFSTEVIRSDRYGGQLAERVKRGGPDRIYRRLSHEVDDVIDDTERVEIVVSSSGAAQVTDRPYRGF